MNTFTVHIRENGEWHCLERFEDRDRAMMMAGQLRNAEIYSGVKAVEDYFDEEALEDKARIIFAWTRKTREQLEAADAERYMERIKAARLEKKEQEEIAAADRRQRIKKALTTASVVCSFLVGVLALYMLETL